MFYMNCENKDVDVFIGLLDVIFECFGCYFDKLDWVSLGGGVFFIWLGYDVEKLGVVLKVFVECYVV